MYGENSETLRFEFTNLLRLARQRTRSATPKFGLEGDLGSATKQIERYRQSVLFWSEHALEASGRPFNLDKHREFERGPVEELRAHLRAAIQATGSPVASLDDLAEPRNSPVTEAWRHAARAAAMGERDFTRAIRPGTRTTDQAMTLLTDASEVLQALLIVDRHLSALPGWKAVDPSSTIERAAAVCVTYASFNQPDYDLDLRGWIPQLRFDSGQPQPGLNGVLQSEANTLVCLSEFPDSGNLRIIFEAQRTVSHYAAQHLRDSDPDLTNRWATRSATYRRLVQATRNLASLQGNAARAAGQAAVAARRAQDLAQQAEPDLQTARRLAHLFDQIDDRLSTYLETGIDDRTYLRQVQLPRLDLYAAGPIRHQRVRYIPVTPPEGNELSDLAHALKPAPAPRRAPQSAGRTRHELRQALYEPRDRPAGSPCHQL